MLRLLVPPLRQSFHLAVEKLFQRLVQSIDVSAASNNRGFAVLVPQQGVEKMLETDVFVASSLGFFEGEIEGCFEFLADHFKLSLFHRALKGIFVLARQVFNQGYLGFSDFISINAGYADAFLVYMKHDLNRFRLLFMKDVLQDLYHKLFSSVIVIV